MWCYITFGTAVVNIVTDPTEVYSLRFNCFFLSTLSQILLKYIPCDLIAFFFVMFHAVPIIIIQCRSHGTKTGLKRLFHDQNDDSNICRLEIALLTFV